MAAVQDGKNRLLLMPNDAHWAQVGGAAQQLAAVLEAQPEGQVAAALGGPVQARAHAADGRAQLHESLGAEAVVLVQGRAVDGPA